jgi:hypothetical protein
MSDEPTCWDEWVNVLAERDALRAQLITAQQQITELEIQLAAARSVPEDAELDALVESLRWRGINGDVREAITALRRRVAELEAEPRHTINLLSDACECGHRRSYHRGWHNASSRLGCIGDDCACEQFAAIAKEPQDA